MKIDIEKLLSTDVSEEFEKAKLEIGEEEYDKRLCYIFGKPVLNFVNTIVINLPGSCYANCAYCIDKDLRKNVIDSESFLKICEQTFNEFKSIKEISITGGSIPAKYFNELMDMIESHYKNIVITWNTNGILISDEYNISNIKHINLHRNSIDEDKNRMVFQSDKPILTIGDAKRLFGDKLTIRVTVDNDFSLEDYLAFNVPLYINRMIPGNDVTNAIFEDVIKKLNISDHIDRRRRNEYLNCEYKGMPVRVCMGDKLAKRVPNRYPVYLNVAIVHRSGKVCGSWYEDDKLLN